MTKIVHISDLHTGYAQFREDLLLQTIDEINKIQPSAVVISGDLTDQGFYREFIEAKEYIENPVTGAHLREISETLLSLESNDATQVMGWPDDLKLRSSMTLFALATKENEVFLKVLD